VATIAPGGVLAGMNALFYLAVARLPLATVGAIEFLGTVVLAALGARTRRNAAALALCVGGVAVLTAIQAGASPLGLVFAFGNCAGFMLYVMLGHRVANTRVSDVFGGIDQLGAAMLIAAVAVTPAGLGAALPAFTHPAWLAWGIGVGVCSSVIPYVTDQLAMARLSRATFALMLALLPAVAVVIGAVVLHQIPRAGGHRARHRGYRDSPGRHDVAADYPRLSASHASRAARVGDVAGPGRVTEKAAAALARAAARAGDSPSARPAMNTPAWVSPAPVVSTASTTGAGTRVISPPRTARTHPEAPVLTMTLA
jgi:hypothetical protein